jgi:L-lactate utilization protein LutC
VSEAREAILARIRTALGRTAEARAAAAAEIGARLAAPRPGPLPSRAAVAGEERIALFGRMARAVGAEVQRLSGPDGIRDAVVEFLRRHNLPARLVRAADPLLDAAGLEADPLLEVRTGVPAEPDPVGLTVALAGIAETGTLLLASAAERPTLLAFLPETMRNSLQNLKHPLGSDTTRCALAARLVLDEVQEVAGQVYHTGVFVHNDKSSGAHHRSELLQGLVIHRDVKILFRNAPA